MSARRRPRADRMEHDLTELVIGGGEVGTALGAVLGCSVRDIGFWSGEYERIHITFPYGDEFVEQVKFYQDHHQAREVVVHSTVPPGTCDPQGWTHSPVRGRHPNLVDALKMFTKFFGGGDSGPAYGDWLRKIGYAVHTPLAVTTELAKLWELVSFGMAVAVEKAVWDACEEWGADWSIAYWEFGRSHNEGVRRLGYSHVAKPVLDHVPGPIGGHCVRENMAYLDHPFARIVEET